MFVQFRDDRGKDVSIEAKNVVRIVDGWPEAAIYYQVGDKIERLHSIDTVSVLAKKINSAKTIEFQSDMVESLQERIKGLEKAVVELRTGTCPRRPNKHLQVTALRLKRQLRRLGRE